MIDTKKFLTSVFSYEMLYSIKLTILTSVCATSLTMCTAIPVSYAMSRYKLPFKKLGRSILVVPIALPELVVGVALVLLFSPDHLGRIIPLSFTVPGIILAQFFVALPYAIRILHTTFNYIDERYEFVARSLGCSEFGAFRRVTLPLAKNGILASSIIAFAKSMGAFGAVLMMGGGTYLKTETLPITVYLNMSYGNLDMAISAACVLLIISFAILIIIEKYFKNVPVY